MKLTVDEKKLYQLVKKALSEVMEEIKIGANSLCARRRNERDRRNLWDTREI